MGYLFLAASFAITAAFAVIRIIKHYGLKAIVGPHQDIVAYSFFSLASVVFFASCLLAAAAVVASVPQQREGRLPSLWREQLALGVMELSVAIVLFTGSVWQQSAGLGLVGIGAMFIVCFLPDPRRLLH